MRYWWAWHSFGSGGASATLGGLHLLVSGERPVPDGGGAVLELRGDPQASDSPVKYCRQTFCAQIFTEITDLFRTGAPC
jgi:hypothetical protein